MKNSRSRIFRIVSLCLAVAAIACMCVLPASAALREGDRGSEVKTVQEKLKRWGYYKMCIRDRSCVRRSA